MTKILPFRFSRYRYRWTRVKDQCLRSHSGSIISVCLPVVKTQFTDVDNK